MDLFEIRGGRSLQGEVSVGGAKNAALPLFASALLADGALALENIPDLRDIRTMEALLGHLGVRVERRGSDCTVDASRINAVDAPYDLVRTMRASVVVLGPLLARHGEARVSLPGGCAIGARPIDQHLKGLGLMGAEISLEEGNVYARAGRLRGARIYFDVPTVTGTENLMMAATLADGETVLENAAREPEVVDLADCLRGMGARIEGDGTGKIIISGVRRLGTHRHRIIPDRVETGTFMAAAGVTRGEVFLRGADPRHLDAVIAKFRDAGIEIAPDPAGLRVTARARPRAVDVKTMPYPAFPTDMQAQFMVLMAVAEGTSVITETVFENRFMHVAELDRMGADISVEGPRATIRGRSGLTGAPVMATDLRASASLVLAGLAAEGLTRVRRIYHLDRGYEALEEKLRVLGADVVRRREA